MKIIKWIINSRETNDLQYYQHNLENALLTFLNYYLCSYFVLIAILFKSCIVYWIGNILHIVVINKNTLEGYLKG